MKTSIDIPEAALADAMRFTGARTKREAILTALADFNRRQRVEALIALAGSFPDFPTNPTFAVRFKNRRISPI
jgi:hypothetical protein